MKNWVGLEQSRLLLKAFTERCFPMIACPSFFDGIDMDQQLAKQTAFMTMVTGGPNNYTGKDMRDGHKHLLEKGLNDSHVDIVIEHLGATLKELGVDDEKIQKVADLANSVRDDVLSR